MRRLVATLLLLALISLLYWRHQDEATTHFVMRGYPITLNGFDASAAWFRRNVDGFPPIVDLGALRLYAPISLNAFGGRECFVLPNYSRCQLTSRIIIVASPQAQTILRNCPQAS
jgi:hypothetical protein